MKRAYTPTGWPCPDGHGPMLALPEGMHYCPHPEHEPRGHSKGSPYIFTGDELIAAKLAAERTGQ